MELKDVITGTRPKTAPQNLINPVKVTQGGRPEGFYRSIVLDVLSVGSALLFGYAYFRYLTSGFSPWYVLAATLLFGTFSVLQVFLTKKIARRVLVIVGEALALVAFFLNYDDWKALLAAGLAAVIFLLWGYFRSSSEAKNSMEISFFRTSSHVLGKTITALLLFMLLIYAPHAEGQGIFMPRESFKIFFDWTSGLLNNFYPNLPFVGSFGDFSAGLVKMELQNNPSFRTLPPPAQKAALTQAMSQITEAVTGATGITPASGELLSDVAYRAIVLTLGNWKGQFQDRFIIAWVIALFLLLRTVGIVFVWVAQFVALIFYEILIASGFMHIAEVTQTKEVVEY